MKKLFSIIFTLLSFYCFAGESYTIIEDGCDLKISTPSLAKREVLKLRLVNGLEAYLISDPDSHQSGAALAVGAGSYDDPKQRPGLAHFLEHMLFLGTEKYPEEAGYTQFLNQHGGSRNAFTASDRTVYMFSINNDAFSEALDRFAQFFIAPLFNPSGIDRECKAVHQEYSKDIPLDSWRAHYVKKTLANPEHPYQHFDIGSMETLKGVSREELKKWYEGHYSADIMHLVVHSDLPIDALKELVIAQFSSVPKREISISKAYPHLFLNDYKANLVYIQPIQQLQTLEFAWELPEALSNDLDGKPEEMVAHLLGHEAPNCLLAGLKKMQLATGIRAQNEKAGRGQSLFILTIALTEKGVKQWESVAEQFFLYLSALKGSSLPGYLFEENKTIDTLGYEFQPRKDIFEEVTEYAYHMVDEPLGSFPKKTTLAITFKPEKVSEFINYLQADNCYYTLTAPSKVAGIKPTRKEKWMEVAYEVTPIAPAKIKKWSQHITRKENVIPEPNLYIPKKLNLIHPDSSNSNDPIAKPALIQDNAHGMLYICQDDRFQVPDIAGVFTFKTPLIHDADAKSAALADLFCMAVDDRLSGIAYFANLAKLSYQLEKDHDGIKLSVDGYSEKAEVLLKKLMEQMTKLNLNSEEFAFFKENLSREYFNQMQSTPLKQGLETLSSILYQDFATAEEKQGALEELSFSDFISFQENLWKKSYLEAMVFGNVDSSLGQAVWDDYLSLFASADYPKQEQHKIKLANFQESKGPSYLVKKSKLPGNALILATDCGTFSFKRRAAHEILTKALEEPFFSELRTRQQTAYIVKNWSKEIERELYSFFAIQSHSHDTRDLLSRFELFIENSLQNLETACIPEERFEAIRQASIYNLQHCANNPKDMRSFLAMLAFDYDGQFDWIQNRIDGLKELTYREFQDLAAEFLGKDNLRRVAICIDGVLPHSGTIKYHKVSNHGKFKQDLVYKSRQ